MTSTEYQEIVSNKEERLSPLAKRSFEQWSQQFLDGGDLFRYYHDRWEKDEGRAALANRTPLQLERDRILYSAGLRKQAEKYHVLYNGQRRIVRSFATHTMRSAQVSRAIARALELNEDFAEAMALGSKVGATPFVHAAKKAVDDWLRETIEQIDRGCAGSDNVRGKETLWDDDLPLPVWIDRLESSSTFDAVTSLMPWAMGDEVDNAYSSGQASYWALCCNPFTVEAVPCQFGPETMFGVWRHSLGLRAGGTSFHHELKMDNATDGALSIVGKEHASFEARIVQFADDITWAIENLADANSAALLNDRQAKYDDLSRELEGVQLPQVFASALAANDAGGLYTFFITDFIEHSKPRLTALEADGSQAAREALGRADPDALIGLSEDGQTLLDKLIEFLHEQVFNEPRVSNRKDMLAEVSRQCVRLLYEGDPAALKAFIEGKSVLERWAQSKKVRANEFLDRKVHRAQAAVTVFAEMSDQEIYDFVGIQAL